MNVPTSSDTSVFADAGLLMQAIADTTDDVIFVKDLAGRYQFANPATLKAVGRDAPDVIGHTDEEFLADVASARRLMENDRSVLASGAAAEMEEPVALPDGRLRYWLTRKTPLRDRNGNVIGLLGIARDITRRKDAESQGEATRMKLEIGIQAAGLVMAEIDYRSNQNHISRELARLLELGDEAMVVPRQAIFDRIHPDDRDRYLRGIAAAVDPAGSGHLAIDVRALVPSGAVRWLHIRLQVTFAEEDGRRVPERGICAARDVTAEITAGRKLREAQRLTESVIEGAGALVYAKDMAGRYILSNHAWRSLHGFDAQRAAQVCDLDIFGPEIAAELQKNDETVVRTGQPLLAQERMVVQGRVATFRSSKFPLYDEAGQVYAVCGVSTDISDVLDADRRKDEFIATLAHELRNPLAPIRTGLEILKLSGSLPPAAARAREIMERQLTHMVRLIDDLLDVSRITRDKLQLKLQPLELRTVVEHALETNQPAVEAAGHALSVQLPAEPVQVMGDLTRLAQVVSNLVSNSVKYTPGQGQIRIECRSEAGEAVIRVCDNGSGIAPAMLPRVFDLFAQAEGSHSTQQGLGIGLWLVKKLVELHGGRIEAGSAGVGQGSTFTVRLPALAAAQVPQPSRTA